MSIEVRTNEFRNSHGKEPRGFGNWAFRLGRDTSDIRRVLFFNGNYGDALKQAKARARELGVDTVTVGA